VAQRPLVAPLDGIASARRGREPLGRRHRAAHSARAAQLAYVIGPRRKDPAIIRRWEPAVVTHRVQARIRRSSRPPYSSSGDDPARRSPDAGGCDRDRGGRELPPRGAACGSRRWAIRWAKPSRVGPYQAQRRAFSRVTVWPDLQAFRGLGTPRTPCFTRERSQVRTPPRPLPDTPQRRRRERTGERTA
jgi:hypothetical protein